MNNNAFSWAHHGQLLRFIINGVIATLVHFAILVLLIEYFNFPYYGLANGIGGLFGIISSYFGNKLFVFQSDRPHGATMWRFGVLYAALFVWNAGFLTLWSDVLDLPYRVGFLIAVAIATGLSYIGNKIWVFQRDGGA